MALGQFDNGTSRDYRILNCLFAFRRPEKVFITRQNCVTCWIERFFLHSISNWTWRGFCLFPSCCIIAVELHLENPSSSWRKPISGTMLKSREERQTMQEATCFHSFYFNNFSDSRWVNKWSEKIEEWERLWLRTVGVERKSAKLANANGSG